MNLKLVRFVVATSALALVTLFTASCGSSSSTKFRVINASPGESNFDVSLDSKVVATNIAYGAATSYLTTGSGSHQFQLNLTGSTNSLLSRSASFAANTQTTVLATDYPAQIAAISLLDDTTTPTTGNFRLRLINAAPSAGAVDAYVVAPSTDVTGVSPTVTSITFEAQSIYQSLAAGNFEVIFTQAGTKNVLAVSGSSALATGKIYSVVLLSQTFGGFTTAQLSDN